MAELKEGLQIGREFVWLPKVIDSSPYRPDCTDYFRTDQDSTINFSATSAPSSDTAQVMLELTSLND